MLPYSASQTKWRKRPRTWVHLLPERMRKHSAGLFISGWLTLETGGASLLRYFSDFREIALRTRKKAG